jgi:hypothetical protein
MSPFNLYSNPIGHTTSVPVFPNRNLRPRDLQVHTRPHIVSYIVFHGSFRDTQTQSIPHETLSSGFPTSDLFPFDGVPKKHGVLGNEQP